MFGILLQAVNMYAAGRRLVVFGRRAVQEFQAVAVRHDHQIIADLDLGGRHIRIDLRIHHVHILNGFRIGRICHVYDLDACALKTSSVKIIFAFLCLI